jgi:hypothetical protein
MKSNPTHKTKTPEQIRFVQEKQDTLQDLIALMGYREVSIALNLSPNRFYKMINGFNPISDALYDKIKNLRDCGHV